jgi:hypothetical protein
MPISIFGRSEPSSPYLAALSRTVARRASPTPSLRNDSSIGAQTVAEFLVPQPTGKITISARLASAPARPISARASFTWSSKSAAVVVMVPCAPTIATQSCGSSPMFTHTCTSRSLGRSFAGSAARQCAAATRMLSRINVVNRNQPIFAPQFASVGRTILGATLEFMGNPMVGSPAGRRL